MKDNIWPSLEFAWMEPRAELATLYNVERMFDAARRRADCLGSLHAVRVRGFAAVVLKSMFVEDRVHSADISQLSI